MSCADTAALLADRLKGLLPTDGERRLESHLAACATCREETASMSTLWTDMEALDTEVPHERMRVRFHAALAAYEERERRSGLARFAEHWWPQRLALHATLAVALLFVGVLIGQRLPSSSDGEIALLRDEIRTAGLALLDHQSASERLLGVAWARRVEPAPQVVDALLERVEYDPNPNVRLAAIEALRARLDRPEVSARLASVLESQDAPLLQVTLAEALLETGGSDAIAAVRRMIDREELDPLVRDYLRTALQRAGGDAAQRPDI